VATIYCCNVIPSLALSFYAIYQFGACATERPVHKHVLTTVKLMYFIN